MSRANAPPGETEPPCTASMAPPSYGDPTSGSGADGGMAGDAVDGMGIPYHLSSGCYCTGCGRGFADLAALAAHEKTHPRERPEKCPVPTCQFHTGGFEFWHECARHALQHYETPILCAYCPDYISPDGRTFGDAGVFERHLLQVHDPFFEFEPSGERPCPICGDIVLSAWDLSIHLSSCVLRNLMQQPHMTASARQGTSFARELDNSATERISRGTTALPSKNDSGTGQALEPLDPAGRRKHPAEWLCHLCPKRYTRASALKAHINNHTGVRPFQCGDCGLTFTRNHDRKTHEALHTGARQFICEADGCGRQFSRLTNLKRHRRRHTKSQRAGSTKPPPENATESQNAAMVLTEMAAFDTLTTPEP